MNTTAHPADQAYDPEQLTPLLAMVRTAAHSQGTAHARASAELRRATRRDPLAAYAHAMTLAAHIGRQLRDVYSVDDMIGEAILLTELHSLGLPPGLIVPSLLPTAALIGGADGTLADQKAGDPTTWTVAARVNQTLAVGLLHVLAEATEECPGDVADRVCAQVQAMTRPA